MIRTADGDEWYTANEVPEMWPDVSGDTVRHWASRGKLNGVRLDGRVYYNINDLTEADRVARTSPRGGKRRVALTSTNHVTS